LTIDSFQFSGKSKVRSRAFSNPRFLSKPRFLVPKLLLGNALGPKALL
jgi:hypothetical protein